MELKEMLFKSCATAADTYTEYIHQDNKERNMAWQLRGTFRGLFDLIIVAGLEKEYEEWRAK